MKSNAVAYNEIHPQFLKLLLTKAIMHIFNAILIDSLIAKIILVPKSETKYRPMFIFPFSYLFIIIDITQQNINLTSDSAMFRIIKV